MTILQVNNMLAPEKTIILEGIPDYREIMGNGLGAFFQNPDEAPQERVFYD